MAPCAPFQALSECRAFQSSEQISHAIQSLPLIQDVGLHFSGSNLTSYVFLAKQLQVTRADLTVSALQSFSDPERYIAAEMQIRIYILLRVCFECSSNTPRPVTHGGGFRQRRKRAGARISMQIGQLDTSWGNCTWSTVLIITWENRTTR